MEGEPWVSDIPSVLRCKAPNLEYHANCDDQEDIKETVTRRHIRTLVNWHEILSWSHPNNFSRKRCLSTSISRFSYPFSAKTVSQQPRKLFQDLVPVSRIDFIHFSLQASHSFQVTMVQLFTPLVLAAVAFNVIPTIAGPVPSGSKVGR